MPKRIYVGNLPFDADEREVKTVFSRYGTVESIQRVDRSTLVVVMASGADEAISRLNGYQMGGRSLNVNEARPRTE